MISDKHEFIFIHYPRTGGSVFEQTYRNLYDPDNDPRKEVSGQNRKHFSAEDYQHHYPEIFRKYHLFGFIRNPYEVMVSRFFSAASYKEMSFADFIFGSNSEEVLGRYNSFFL